MILTKLKPPTIALAILTAVANIGCSSKRDDRLTRMAEQQAALNQEMVKLNRDVAQGLTKITQANAEFRNEALTVQKQLQEQRVELIAKQEALDEERRQYAQRDPLVARAVTHVGLTLACLLPLLLSWHMFRQPVDVALEPAVNELLLEDLTSEQPVLISRMSHESRRLTARSDTESRSAAEKGGATTPVP